MELDQKTKTFRCRLQQDGGVAYLARQIPNGSMAAPNSINVFHVNKNTNIGGKPMNKKYSMN